MPDIDMELGYAEVLGTNVAVDMILGYVEYIGATLPPALQPLDYFDSVASGSLSTYWSTTQVVNTGTAGSWLSSSTRFHNSSSNSGKFNSSVATNANQTRLFNATAIDFTIAPAGPQLVFWMYHDNGNSAKTDNIQVQVSTNGGSTWTNVGSAYNRYSATVGWVQNTIDLSAYASSTTVLIGFLATSNVGGDMFIDDVYLYNQPTGTNLAVDMIMGYAEVLGSNVSVDMVLGYAEIVYGSTPAPIYGPRWQ